MPWGLCRLLRRVLRGDGVPRLLSCLVLAAKAQGVVCGTITRNGLLQKQRRLRPAFQAFTEGGLSATPAACSIISWKAKAGTNPEASSIEKETLDITEP
jgi:HAMP domain-containing protein